VSEDTAANKEQKPSPLELLARRNSPITDVVYGSDHPAKQPQRKAPAAPPPTKRAAAPSGTSQVGDLLPSTTKQKLAALSGRLEAQQRRKEKKS